MLDPTHLAGLAAAVPAAELPGIYRAFAADLARLAAEMESQAAAGDAAAARATAHALAGAAAGVGARDLEALARMAMQPNAPPIGAEQAAAIVAAARAAAAALEALAAG
jgi:HPt (histidine-containing phosphotransfer) domain-containing protein